MSMGPSHRGYGITMIPLKYLGYTACLDIGHEDVGDGEGAVRIRGPTAVASHRDLASMAAGRSAVAPGP
jgi:hypothetical protein